MKNNIRETIRLLTESQTRIALRLYYSGKRVHSAPDIFFRSSRKDSLSDPFYQEREGQVYARQFRVRFEKGDAFLILPVKRQNIWRTKKSRGNTPGLPLMVRMQGTLLRH